MGQDNTFLSQPEDVRTSYLSIMAAIASADKENTPEEVAFMNQMAAAANISEENKKIVTAAMTHTKETDLLGHLNKLKDNNIKFALITDLLNLANKDGSLEPSEVAAIAEVNKVLGISEEQYKALQQYVEAANKEASKEDGTPDVNTNGELKAAKTNFLDSLGLTATFKQMGIPVDNFTNGSTVSTQLTSAAFFFVQNYVKANTQNIEGSLGDKIGGFLGAALSNLGQTKDEKGNPQQGGISQMIAGFVGSEAGKATINNVLNNVVNSTAKGKGMGNLMDVIGAGASQANLGAILGAFMQQPSAKK